MKQRRRHAIASVAFILAFFSNLIALQAALRVGDTLDQSNDPLSFDEQGSAYVTVLGTGIVRLEMPSRRVAWIYPLYEANLRSLGTVENIVVAQNGIVYVANKQVINAFLQFWGTSALFALRATDGSLVWRKDGPFSNLIYSAEGNLFVSKYGDLQRLNPATGETMWPQWIWGQAAAIAPNRLLITGDQTDRVYARNQADGAVIWASEPNAESNSTPRFAFGTDGLIIDAGVNLIRALDPSTGEVRWSRHTEGREIRSTPVVDASGKIHVAVRGAFLELDGATGRKISLILDNRPETPGTTILVAGNGQRFAGSPLSASPSGLIFTTSDLRQFTNTGIPMPSIGWSMGRGTPQARGDSSQIGAPSIPWELQDAVVSEIGEVFFSVAAIGTPPLAYKWFKGDQELPARTSSSITLGPEEIRAGERIRVEVSNDLGVARSRSALAGYEVRTAKFGAGEISQTPAQRVYAPGQIVRLIARPPVNRGFETWEGDSSSREPEIEISINKNISTRAVFETRAGDVLWRRDDYLPYRALINGVGYLYFIQYRTSDQEMLRCVDVESGEIVWTMERSGYVAAADDNRVYYISSGWTYALDAKTGLIHWSKPNLGAYKAMANGILIFASGSEGLGVDAATGEIRWRIRDAGGSSLQTVAISADGTAACSFGSNPTYILRVNPSSGGYVTSPGALLDELYSLRNNEFLGRRYGTFFRLSEPARIFEAIGGAPPRVLVGHNQKAYIERQAVDLTTMTSPWTIAGEPLGIVLADDSLLLSGSVAINGQTGEERWRSSEALSLSQAAASPTRPILIAASGSGTVAIKTSAPLASSPWPTFWGDSGGHRASPAIPIAKFEAVQIAANGNELTLGLETYPFENYQLQSAAAPNSQTWMPLFDFGASGNRTDVRAPFQTSTPQRYFRVAPR